ncbi:ATP-binding protein [Okeania sp. SIO2B3]|uniref:AAA family ATPase n=1 Tax=Okeania sp. SIO2B3 TaxID=2607784 RepID=UPI0013C08ACB|nr:ATP-binding protein [Okeania sp. SIO2B3]NET44511.1 ATP-binding protein [Okeania sp. SIO2B3]
MKKNNDSVPRLDLAPQLKRPLSIWNPLDYLRLLYWVFFFPQAVRWYVENYGGGEGLAEQTTWQSKLEFLRQHPNLLKLLFQGLILTVCVPYLICGLLEQIGFMIDWEGVALGVAFGLAGGVASGVAFGVASGVALGVAFSLAGGVTGGVALGVVFGVASGMVGGVAVRVARVMVICVVIGVLSGVASGVAFGVASGVALCVASWHPENWLIGVPLNSISIQNRSFLLPRITPIPLPLLTTHLKFWLRKDWQLGLENIDQLLRYSLQFIPIVNAFNQVLAETPPEQMIYRISQVAENPYDWKLVKFASTSLVEGFKLEFFKGLSIVFRLPKVSSAPTRLDTPSRAIAAGFWHLHEKEAEEATAAFEKVRSLLYGEEMFLLAQTLTQFQTATSPDAIAEIQIPNFPPGPHLRPTTWEALKGLRRVVEDTQLIVKATSRPARAFALARAIGKLKEILDNADALPQAERGLIVDIAQTWQKALETIANNVGDISITKPVKNPYVIGDPVESDLFVGREDIMRELEELWVMNSHKQSVVLYGHRRMGKTSILRNVANYSGSDIQVVYVNLQNLAAISEGMGEVFLAIGDEISVALNFPPPDTEELLRFPQRTFKLYLQQAIQKLENKGLIIALDEFETIEELIDAQQLPLNFMAVLRGFVQMSPKIAFAFAGLHTLEEMTEDYFQPFFASVIPIRVGFLNRATTRQLLANPNPDFLLTYEPEAIDRIYDLTFGQPYLVQLLGFLLVRRYNDQTFEQGKPREPIFTVADVEAIIHQNELFQNGRYYFTGVWGQAAQDAPGQQEILRALADYPEGCSRATIQEITGLEESILNDALETLARHDVIIETEGNLRFAVELFRRWVESQ